MRVSELSSLSGLLLTANIAAAIELDLDNEASILSAGRTIVDHIFTIYKGNETGGTPGLLPQPYYWWEAGLMFDSLLNYWAVSNDTGLTDTIAQAMAFQVGPDNNYMPPNQSKSLGNDDQSFWANAAMTAAEINFPEPANLNVTWLELAENVFNSQVVRWNTETCGGGLKWQIFTFNNGYNYKNSVSTLSLATLSARLARFTGNTTYSDWAEKSLSWLADIGLLNVPSNTSDTSRIAIYDGTDDLLNCTEINHIEWSQNSGLLLSASAYGSNATMGTKTFDGYSSLGLLYANNTFATTQNDRAGSNVSSGIISEVACIPSGNCNVDQKAMRASLARGLSRARDLTMNANITRGSDGPVIASRYDLINRILRDSAQAAARQCTGGNSGTVCGLDWRATEYDGMTGIGEDLSALEVILANLPARVYATANTSVAGVAGNTGGNSTSGGGNGTGSTESQSGQNAASASRVSIVGLSAALMGALVLFV